MTVVERPQTRFAAALVAAGVVTATCLTTLPAPPVLAPEVANASVITDVLSSFGKGVEVVSSTVGIHVDATISLPFEATLAVLAAQQHPELGASVLSYLVQRFVNPAVGAPIYAYPWETEQTVALLASLLPHPLGPSATDPGLLLEAGKAFAAAFDGVLRHLGDPLPGFGAVQDVMNDTVSGGVVVAGQLAARAPLYMAWNAVNYLGNLPVNVEASIESAIADPRQIPGLVSHLVYGLLSPDANVGLLGKLLNNAVDPLTWLPAPIGFGSNAAVGLANQVRAAVSEVVNKVLSVLPAPVTPSVLPPAAVGQGQPFYGVGAGKGATTPDSLPSAALVDSSLVPLSAVPDEPTPSKVVASKVAPKHEAVQTAVIAESAVGEPDSTTIPAPAVGDVDDADVKPVKIEPVKTKPVKTKPVETKPAKTKPVETKPVKTRPTTEKPAVGTGEPKADDAKESASPDAA